MPEFGEYPLYSVDASALIDVKIATRARSSCRSGPSSRRSLPRDVSSSKRKPLASVTMQSSDSFSTDVQTW